MKKLKVHTVKLRPRASDGLGHYRLTRCGVYVFLPDENWVTDWLGVPKADRCKNCLRAKGRR